MTTRPPTVLRSALALLSVSFVLQQIGLALLVFVLSVAWLHVPDASVIDVAGSLVLALLVLVLTGVGETSLILRLCGRERAPGRRVRGALLLLAGVALWLGWSTLLDHLRGIDFLWAGYLNSRFPHSMRNFFSFEHIVIWLGWIWAEFEWIGAGMIGLVVFAATSSDRPFRAMVRALRSITYWAILIGGTAVATVLTGSLMQWTPGRGLRIEMVSLALRLGVAACVDAAVAGLLLAVLAVCVRRSDGLYGTPAGMPEESQPRIAERP
jgi:hypothetical protein